MQSQRRHWFPGPAIAIATARGQLVLIENAGDQFIIGDKDKLPNSGDDVLRGAVALPTVACPVRAASTKRGLTIVTVTPA
jgi:hypothetical protein